LLRVPRGVSARSFVLEAGLITKEQIEEVRDRASIVEVVSDFVPLKRKGHNYLGLCPFHSEKTPSFSVNDEKRIYYCFGCHESGDVISFVMKKDGLEFPDAVRTLAARFGVRIEEDKRSGPDPREVFYRVNEAAAEYFVGMLASNAGKGAREYLGSRGYGDCPELLKTFSIGYAPDSWDGLANFLKRKRIPEDAAAKAGVLSVSRKNESRRYDRFRNRLIFPIKDIRGRTVAFGGRALAKDDEPKYLNSPESPVFRKGEVLYGLSEAKRAISEHRSVIVVEGYFDLLALVKHGFANTVATMGTALTPAHIRTLKGYADVVYALFDSDSAGRRAAARAAELFVDLEVPCRAVTMPEGSDPDDLLATSGPETMKKALDRAEPLVEFYLRELRKATDVSTPEGKGAYLNDALSLVGKVRNIAERDHYAGFIASTLSMPVEHVYQSLGHPAGKSAQRRTRQTGAPEGRGKKGSRLKELTVLKIMLARPDLFNPEVEAAVGRFTDPALKEAGEIIARLVKAGGFDAGAVLDEIKDEQLRALIAGMIMETEEGFIDRPERMLTDTIEGIMRSGMPKESTLSMIRRLEEAGLAEEAAEMKKRLEGL